MKYSGWQGRLQMENCKCNKSVVGETAVRKVFCAADFVHVIDDKCF
jgi:hypothetical protein